MTALGPAERAVLLAFADDEHLMGQRHTEWIGVAPFLEEDLAFASIGQDELGHAAMLYALVISDPSDETPTTATSAATTTTTTTTTTTGAVDIDIDVLAFRREPGDYRSCWLVEAACTEWASALVRHWLYDTAEALRWRELTGSSDDHLRAVAARAMSEERYHLRHADALLDALAGDVDAGARIAGALAELLPLGRAVFDDPLGAGGAVASVVGRPLSALEAEWRAAVDRRFGGQEWAVIEPVAQAARTIRSTAFATVYADMREVIMLDPDATW